MGGGSAGKLTRFVAGVGTLGASELLYYGPKRAQEKAAEAAGNAALAQQREAKKNYSNVSRIANEATVAGLANLDKDIARQDKNIARQEQLIQSIDPTIMEASQQALKLLRGEQSSTLKPMQDQRNQQRQKLVNTLREQLGPGAETSTAGIQALTRFDSETNSLLSNAQQQAIQNLGGTAQQFTSSRPDMFREIMGGNNLGQQGSSLRMGEAALLNAAANPLQQTAGAQYVGDQMKYQQQAAQLQQLGNLAITAGTAYATGGMGAMRPGAAAGAGAATPGFIPSNTGSMIPTQYNSSYLGQIGG